MPNVLDATGLTVQTREELVTYFTEQFQAIYGADINLSSDTPDGQMLNIFVQAILNVQDLIVSVYNSFDPDNAIGNVLDQRVTINGIQRQSGTYTVTPITLVNSTSVNLYGVDQEDDADAQAVYTISDNAGNRWVLLDTELGLTAGTHSLSFRALLPGEQLTIPNTITTQVTIVLGVTSVNNPATYSSLGVNEESDASLRVRRQQAVSLASQGYLAGLLAALENIDGVTSAFVYENISSVTDSDGVPGHSIWVIVAGAGAEADIAEAIYTKRNAGCGMFGAESYDITQVDGSLFTVYWDNFITRNLFIAFTATSIDGIQPPNIEAIREGLVTSFTPGVYEQVDINGLATAVQAIDPNTLVTAAGFSTAGVQVLDLSLSPNSGAFKIAYDGGESASINYNDNAVTFKAKMNAVPGLEDVVITGTIIGQQLTYDFSAVDDVLGLITVTDNTLQNGATPITFSFDEDYTDTLIPPSKQNQFIVTEANIIILPMILSPTTNAVSTTEDVQFTGLGGYGDYVYTITVNASSASIDADTGLYTAGAIAGVDTVTVTDAFGNTATATVTVI